MSERLEAEFDAQGHVDEGTIHTWLDGAFADEVASQVENHVNRCAHCQANVAEARGFIAGATRITRALDELPSNIVPANDIERAAARIVAAAAIPAALVAASTVATSKTTRRLWHQSTGIRIAVTLVVMVGGSAIVWNRADRTVPAASVATIPVPSNNSAAQSLAQPGQRVAERRPLAKTRGKPEPAAAPPKQLQERPMSVAAAPAQSGATVAADRVNDAERKKEASVRNDARNISGKVADMSANVVAGGGRAAVAPSPVATSLSATASPARAQRALGGEAAFARGQSCWILGMGDGAQGSRFNLVINDTSFARATNATGQLVGWPAVAQSAAMQLIVDERDVLRGTASVGDHVLAIELTHRGNAWVGTETQSRANETVTHPATLALQNIGVCK